MKITEISENDFNAFLTDVCVAIGINTPLHPEVMRQTLESASETYPHFTIEDCMEAFVHLTSGKVENFNLHHYGKLSPMYFNAVLKEYSKELSRRRFEESQQETRQDEEGPQLTQQEKDTIYFNGSCQILQDIYREVGKGAIITYNQHAQSMMYDFCERYGALIVEQGYKNEVWARHKQSAMAKERERRITKERDFSRLSPNDDDVISRAIQSSKAEIFRRFIRECLEQKMHPVSMVVGNKNKKN